MKRFDPYATLGVERDATDAQIKEAAKRKAKSDHPDAGGDRDRFIDGRRALALLLDPARRQKFDQTGEAEEPESEGKDQADAMNVIFSELGKLTDGFMNSGFSVMMDPRKIDVRARLRTTIQATIDTNAKALAVGQQQQAFLQDFAKRFTRRKRKGPNSIRRAIEDHARKVTAELSRIERAQRIHQLAIEMVDTYDFEADSAPVYYQTVFFTS